MGYFKNMFSKVLLRAHLFISDSPVYHFGMSKITKTKKGHWGERESWRRGGWRDGELPVTQSS